MADQRNFRSAYLEKVVTKGAEEKKSLDTILNEKPIDIEKLQQFCVKNNLPATFRSYIWKLLLGILPTHQEVVDFVLRQRREQYEDGRQTLIVMQRISDKTPPAQVLLRMMLVEAGRLPLNEHKLLENLNNRAFLALCEGLYQVEDDDFLCYWLSSKLWHLQDKHHSALGYMKEQLEALLKREDSQLHSHLHTVGSFPVIPTTLWFKSFFAGALPDSAFERILDRVIAGSFLFLVCVALSSLIAVRRPLLNKHNTDDLLKYLKKFPEESGDVIVLKAIEFWTKHGQSLITSAPKSNSHHQIDQGLT